MYLDNDVVIVAAKRTPIGNFCGGLSSVPAHMLTADLIKNLLLDTKIKQDEIKEVILGQVLSAGCGQNPARQAVIHAGLNKTIPAYGVNQVCGSGLKAIMLGAMSIKENDGIVIAGGHENMSLSPHFINLRNGTKMGNASMADSMIIDGLWDAFNDYHMGITAENIAKKYSITRKMQDEFAYNSQLKAMMTHKEGLFKNELLFINVKDRKKDIVVLKDEFIKPETNLETLSALRPAFQADGTVTAGNSSGINDGAAVVLLMSYKRAKGLKLTPMARIKSFAQEGVDPAYMGIGPVYASREALKKADWVIKDLDVVEANEAFAAQAIVVNNELGLDPKKVNMKGGAIALGHPIGASGARILVTLTHLMNERNYKKGLATLCVGGGMGVAMCLERV